MSIGIQAPWVRPAAAALRASGIVAARRARSSSTVIDGRASATMGTVSRSA